MDHYESARAFHKWLLVEEAESSANDELMGRLEQNLSLFFRPEEVQELLPRAERVVSALSDMIGSNKEQLDEGVISSALGKVKGVFEKIFSKADKKEKGNLVGVLSVLKKLLTPSNMKKLKSAYQGDEMNEGLKDNLIKGLMVIAISAVTFIGADLGSGWVMGLGETVPAEITDTKKVYGSGDNEDKYYIVVRFAEGGGEMVRVNSWEYMNLKEGDKVLVQEKVGGITKYNYGDYRFKKEIKNAEGKSLTQLGDR